MIRASANTTARATRQGNKTMTSPDTTRTAYGNEIREAFSYLMPHQYADGPVTRDGTKMRAALETVQGAITQLQAERDSLRIRLQEAEREIERLGHGHISGDLLYSALGMIGFQAGKAENLADRTVWEAAAHVVRLALLTQEESR